MKYRYLKNLLGYSKEALLCFSYLRMSLVFLQRERVVVRGVWRVAAMFLQKPRLDKPNTGSTSDASALLHFTLKDSKYRKWWHNFPIIPKLSPEEDHSNPKYIHIVHIHCLTSWSPPNGVSGPSVSEIIRQIPSWLSLLLSQQKLLSSCAGEAQPF